ncbi:MAG: hypothetical protein LRY53_01185 [Burkholderiaceae bacterium]|nr:hypothetical protein [Burkholderiaceae bacterium]MCD8515730.1 hypothetical protein [Burkholderiaceae bacterium]MCD8564291.1 hypothetical protein [Burkholderiaceae bacterium]
MALDESNQRVRFGSCKRSASAHTADALASFKNHVESFIAARDHQHLQRWSKEMVVFSPAFSDVERHHLKAKGVLPLDLNDYAALF